MLVAGCGGGSAPKPQPVPVEQAKAEVSYKQVKRLALADLECKSTKDLDLGPVGPGEVYTRLECDGDAVFDYVVGDVAFAANCQVGVLNVVPLWYGEEGPACVGLPLAGPSIRSALRDLARRIRKSCGCGKVVKP